MDFACNGSARLNCYAVSLSAAKKAEISWKTNRRRSVIIDLSYILSTKEEEFE